MSEVNSQDSSLSVASSNEPRLLASLSNISNFSSADTLPTSPAQSSAPSSQHDVANAKALPSNGPSAPKTPSINTDIDAPNGQAPASASTEGRTESRESSLPSPMSIEAPERPHGVKRTASGMRFTPTIGEQAAKRHQGHSRNISMESSSTATRSSELAAQLKTRLSYAMVKVQHGWESESLDQLEERTSQTESPVTSHFGELSQHSYSPQRSTSHRRRMSAYSESSDSYLTSPGDFHAPRGISRSLNATPSYYAEYSQRSPKNSLPVQRALMALSAAGEIHTPNPQYENGLAPAAYISSRRSRRSHTTNVPPSLAALRSDGKSHSDLGPRGLSSTSTRPGILRMPSGQAEREAIDTLIFMASPHAPSRTSHGSLHVSQGSTTRTDPAVKRVAFESHHGEEFGARHHVESPRRQRHHDYHLAEDLEV